MKHLPLPRLLLASALVALAAPHHGLAADATIEGTVALPAPRVAKASARYNVKGGTVAEPEKPTAIVFLEGKFTPPTPPSTPAAIVQKGYQFTPALSAVHVGAQVLFPNADDEYHHVFTYSKPEFDLGRYRKDEKPPSVVFSKPGVFHIGCEIHAHMQATLLVLETPHFVRTDPQGKFKLALPGVPPGAYTLRAWIDAKTQREQKIEIKDGAAIRVDFPAK